MLYSLPQGQCTMIDLCWNKHHEREAPGIVQSLTSLSGGLPHSAVPLQRSPPLDVPAFCHTTQRPCWAGSLSPEERPAQSQRGLAETHALRARLRGFEGSFMRDEQKVNIPQSLRSGLRFHGHQPPLPHPENYS